MRLSSIFFGWMLCNTRIFAFAGDTNTDRLVKRSPKSLYSVERSNNQRRGIFDFLNTNKNPNDKNDQLMTTGDARNNDFYVSQPNNPEAFIIPAAETDEAMNKQEATKGSPEVVTIDQVEKKREDNDSQTKALLLNASEDKTISPANVKEGQNESSAAPSTENNKDKSDLLLNEDKNNAKLDFDSGNHSAGPALGGNIPDSARTKESDKNVHENQASVPTTNGIGREENGSFGSSLQESNEYDYVYVNEDSEDDVDESQFYQQGYYDALRDFGMDNVGQGNSDVNKIPEAYRSTDENRPQDVSQEHVQGTPLGVSQPVPQNAPQEDLQRPSLKEGQPEVPQADVPQADVPQAGIPQPEVPQAEVPQAGIPQAEVPQAEVPQAEVPQAGIPQAEVPQAGIPQAEVPQAEVPQAALQEPSQLAQQDKKIEGSPGTSVDGSINNGDLLDSSVLDRAQFEEAFGVPPELSAQKNKSGLATSGLLPQEDKANVSLIHPTEATKSTEANNTITGNLTLNETASSTNPEQGEVSVQHTLLQTDDDEIIDINTLDFSMGNKISETQVSSADSIENSNDLSQYKAVVLQNIGEDISSSGATFLSCTNAKYVVLATFIYYLSNF